ncbi:MAG: peptidylprolyl isomerase [Pseudomonadota bacterium]
MRKNILLAPLAALFASTAIISPAMAGEESPKEYPSPNAIVDAAPASEWVAIAPSDLLVMDLEPDAQGQPRRVIIQLMPPPFSQGWIRNIRKLAAAKFWDGTSINRVQDNYVVQWGDAGYDNPESGGIEQKALPEGLEVVPESAYGITTGVVVQSIFGLSSVEDVQKLMIEAQQSPSDETLNTPIVLKALGSDPYANRVSFLEGWPMGLSGAGLEETIWPVHCYGMVGVGRNLSPDTGTGAELYTVIGHAPRHLDRNIALVGRIVEGMEHLSSLPRGKGELGFYADPQKRVPIQSIRVASELPADQQPKFQYLDNASSTFARYAGARANRRDPFFIKPAGGADICNIPVPVRRVKAD